MRSRWPPSADGRGAKRRRPPGPVRSRPGDGAPRWFPPPRPGTRRPTTQRRRGPPGIPANGGAGRGGTVRGARPLPLPPPPRGARREGGWDHAPDGGEGEGGKRWAGERAARGSRRHRPAPPVPAPRGAGSDEVGTAGPPPPLSSPGRREGAAGRPLAAPPPPEGEAVPPSGLRAARGARSAGRPCRPGLSRPGAGRSRAGAPGRRAAQPGGEGGAEGREGLGVAKPGARRVRLFH